MSDIENRMEAERREIYENSASRLGHSMKSCFMQVLNQDLLLDYGSSVRSIHSSC